ncbi:MAG TPA: protoporphyrinogen oxidase [Pseudonocardia sp.]|nr:protoporphyrinogen oxidase [Pseudonocardia sp.]
MVHPGNPRVAVVGGGISGLAAAHRLRVLLGPAASVTLLEQRARLGGVLHTVGLAGVPFDVGAEAFLVRRPEVLALAAELGLGTEVVHPGPAAPSVRAGGRTVPLPAGTLLGVPGSAARLDGLLSPAGLAAAAGERTRPLTWEPGSDVALGGLLRERFGDEVADRLADPLLGGVYAGRVDGLGLRATVPALAAALDAGAASLTAAADAALAAPRPPAGSPDRPVFGAFRGGYRVLLDALAAAAAADVRLGTTVRALHRLDTGWRLVIGPATAPEALDVDAVVLAVPAPAAARLLADVAPAAAGAAAQIELASSAVVALAYRAADTRDLPATSGVLVAADEPLAVKAVTHSTTKWGHLDPDGLVRLRASLGRHGEVAALQVDDAELVARVRADLATLAGVRADPVAVHVQRWGGGLPQYGVGHPERVRALEAGLPAGLAVAGAALHGVGVPACVATARAAAERVAGLLPTAHPHR